MNKTAAADADMLPNHFPTPPDDQKDRQAEKKAQYPLAGCRPGLTDGRTDTRGKRDAHKSMETDGEDGQAERQTAKQGRKTLCDEMWCRVLPDRDRQANR